MEFSSSNNMSASSKLSRRPVSNSSVSLPRVSPVQKVQYQDNDNGTEDRNSDIWASGSDYSDAEPYEGRLSRALQEWMPEYVIRHIEPRERTKREPIYSARLGREPRIKRAPSEESIATKLSLLSCSTNGKPKFTVRRRRRKKKVEAPTKCHEESKWVILANRKSGALDKMMTKQAAQGTALAPSEIPIFDMLEKEEQHMVFKCGLGQGLVMGPGLKKSNSTTNLKDDQKPPQRPRASAGQTKILGRAIDFQRLRQQMIQQKIAILARQQLMMSRQSSRNSLRRKSRGSLSIRRGSNASIDFTMETPSEPAITLVSQEEPEVRTAIWGTDDRILEIDLNRELSSKVRRKIDTTTRALTRVTGYGDDNELKTTVGTLEEFPFHVDEDYGYYPRIVQKLRISPHLSHVIREDIKVRMGRPRYHEISEQDLAVWNRGQALDRTHRNLKVFNWLHSLRESEFESDIEPVIDDRPPGDNIRTGEIIHIKAVDEPDIRPLLERLKTDYVR